MNADADETLVTYRTNTGRQVSGHRVGDFAVRQLDHDAVFHGLNNADREARGKYGDWLVDHVPTGINVTSCREYRQLAWFLADTLAWSCDGLTEPPAVFEAVTRITPWFIEQVRTVIAGGVPVPLRLWAAEHGVKLTVAPVVVDERAFEEAAHV